MMLRKAATRCGFTLVELLIVIAIISMLALIAVPNFEEAQTRAKVSAVKNNMRITGTKFEMLNMDTNYYPLSGKWRWVILWRVLSGEEEDPHGKFRKRMAPLFGPHWDLFEWELLKQNALQNTDWMCKEGEMHLFNGFNFFSPPTMVEALQPCSPESTVPTIVQWEDSALAHWEPAVRVAGNWLLVSPGPDLILESPAWIEDPCGSNHKDLHPEGYTERGLFTEYDPTNGTVSYDNIFRTQKNPGGLRADAQFNEAFLDPVGAGVACAK